eukprot:Hpha_TRINITY_DN26340_c0_g1::TRINITY_DN26340_c0_g1_i1::g.9520::m.9520
MPGKKPGAKKAAGGDKSPPKGKAKPGGKKPAGKDSGKKAGAPKAGVRSDGLRVGVEIAATGLTEQPAIDGQRGRVIAFQKADAGRWAVVAVIGTDMVALMPENCSVVPGSFQDMRFDDVDNALYSIEEFTEFYGPEGAQEKWKNGKVPDPPPPDMGPSAPWPPGSGGAT